MAVQLPLLTGAVKQVPVGSLGCQVLLLPMLLLLQVSRMGWVPTRASQCDCGAEVNAQADLGMKHYCRLMEAYVPMHAHLEIGLALEVLPQVQPVAQSAAVGTTDGTGGYVL